MGCSQWLFFKAIDSNHTDATYDCYDADTDINNNEEEKQDTHEYFLLYHLKIHCDQS